MIIKGFQEPKKVSSDSQTLDVLLIATRNCGVISEIAIQLEIKY